MRHVHGPDLLHREPLRLLLPTGDARALRNDVLRRRLFDGDLRVYSLSPSDTSGQSPALGELHEDHRWQRGLHLRQHDLLLPSPGRGIGWLDVVL